MIFLHKSKMRFIKITAYMKHPTFLTVAGIISICTIYMLMTKRRENFQMKTNIENIEFEINQWDLLRVLNGMISVTDGDFKITDVSKFTDILLGMHFKNYKYGALLMQLNALHGGIFDALVNEIKIGKYLSKEKMQYEFLKIYRENNPTTKENFMKLIIVIFRIMNKIPIDTSRDSLQSLKNLMNHILTSKDFKPETAVTKFIDALNTRIEIIENNQTQPSATSITQDTT